MDLVIRYCKPDEVAPIAYHVHSGRDDERKHVRIRKKDKWRDVESVQANGMLIENKAHS
jgi:hypothetical protein